MSELKTTKPVVWHYRNHKTDAQTGKEITIPTEGVTVVFLPEHRRFGIALCCEKDNFCRQRGRHIATVRAEAGKISNKHRFPVNLDYSGPLEMDHLRRTANAFVRSACVQVGNNTTATL